MQRLYNIAVNVKAKYCKLSCIFREDVKGKYYTILVYTTLFTISSKKKTLEHQIKQKTNDFILFFTAHVLVRQLLSTLN